MRGLQPRRHSVGQGRARRAGRGQLGEREPAIGRADHAHDPVGQLEISVADLEQMGGELSRLVGDGFRGDERGTARHHGVAARVGPDAERDQRGVAVLDHDVIGPYAELIGDDLGEHGGRALTMR